MCKQLQHLRRHAGLTRRQPSDEASVCRKPGGEISASHKANRARPAFNVKRERSRTEYAAGSSLDGVADKATG